MIPAYTCPVLGDFPALDMPIEANLWQQTREWWAAQPFTPVKVRGYGMARSPEELHRAVGNG